MFENFLIALALILSGAYLIRHFSSTLRGFKGKKSCRCGPCCGEVSERKQAD